MSAAERDDGLVTHLPIAENDVAALVRRINRAIGQLNAVTRMLEEGRGCAEVIPQFAAGRKALDAVAFKMMESALTSCVSDPHATFEDRERLHRLFLSLS